MSASGFTVETEGPNAGGRYGWTAFFQMGDFRRQISQSTTSYETPAMARSEGERAVAALVAHACRDSRSYSEILSTDPYA